MMHIVVTDITCTAYISIHIKDKPHRVTKVLAH